MFGKLERKLVDVMEAVGQTDGCEGGDKVIDDCLQEIYALIKKTDEELSPFLTHPVLNPMVHTRTLADRLHCVTERLDELTHKILVASVCSLRTDLRKAEEMAAARHKEMVEGARESRQQIAELEQKVDVKEHGRLMREKHQAERLAQEHKTRDTRLIVAMAFFGALY